MIWRYHPEAAEEFLEACIHYSEISQAETRDFDLALWPNPTA